MGVLNTYITPKKTGGNFYPEAEYSEYLKQGGVSKITEKTSDTEFESGLIRNSHLKLTLINNDGKFSTAGDLGSIFPYTRSGSKVRIAWQTDEDVQPHNIILGETTLGAEEDVFSGLISDKTTTVDIKKQDVSFQVLGFASVLENVLVNYSDLDGIDYAEAIIKKILDQDEIKKILTYDAANISVGLDFEINDASSLENKTVNEALEILIKLTNSIMYVEGAAIRVTSREPSTEPIVNFYGQGSDRGIENIINISKLTNGLSQTYNFWRWIDGDDILLTSIEENSRSSYGTLIKDIKSPLVSEETGRQSILDSQRDSFSYPKKRLVLTVPLTYQTLAMKVRQRVSIDYPSVAVATEKGMPLYGQAVYGTDDYPYEPYITTISHTKTWKIIGRKLDFKRETVDFNLIEV